MKITRNNYEQYFLDYYEGSLDPVKVGELMLFLEQNPDLQQEFDSFRMIILEEETETKMFSKDLLKKEEITPNNSDTFLAAFIEEDLSGQQLAETEAFIASSSLAQRDLELMKKTKLSPDLNIIFPYKSSLKKAVIIPLYRNVYRIATAAAVITLLFGLFLSLPKVDVKPDDLIVITPPVELPSIEPSIPVTEAEIITTPGQTPEQVQITTPEKPVREVPAQMARPEPLLAEMISSRTPSIPRQTASAASLEEKTEFEYWSPQVWEYNYQDDEFFQQEQPRQRRTFTDIARNRIQDNIPDDIRVDQSKFSLWELAGRGLAGISNLTGIPLNVEQERDVNGGLLQLAVGQRLEIRKREK